MSPTALYLSKSNPERLVYILAYKFKTSMYEISITMNYINK